MGEGAFENSLARAGAKTCRGSSARAHAHVRSRTRSTCDVGKKTAAGSVYTLTPPRPLPIGVARPAVALNGRVKLRSSCNCLPSWSPQLTSEVTEHHRLLSFPPVPALPPSAAMLLRTAFCRTASPFSSISRPTVSCTMPLRAKIMQRTAVTKSVRLQSHFLTSAARLTRLRRSRDLISTMLPSQS